MTTTPTIEARSAQPYVAILGRVPMSGIPQIADRLSDVFGWLGERGIKPAGPPFFKYNVIDMARELEIEVGVPVAEPVPVDGEILAGVLPAGRFVTVRHRGHPAGLADVTGDLLAWGDEQGLRWDAADTPDGRRWGCRLEIYFDDPAVQPDMNQWETELAFRLAD